MKIVFFEIENWESDFLKQRLHDHETVFFHERLTEETAEKASDADVVSIFIYSNITRQILEKLPQTKYITTRSTGFDHIDLAACKGKSIAVSNVPSYGEHSVAEHAFALILALTRNILSSVEKTRRGDFSPDGLQSIDLFGKTLGVVGTGKIGKQVIEIAAGFGMKTIAFNRSEDEELKSKFKTIYKGLEEVLKESDVVSIHVPHTPQTHHLINRDNIKLMRQGSILINTARGPIVETQAILEALESKILKGAGLDVLEEEGSLREERELLSGEYLNQGDVKTKLIDHILLNRDDVIITPHNAFNSKEALLEILDVTIENLKNYFQNSLINQVM